MSAVAKCGASSIATAINTLFAGEWDDDEPMSPNWYNYGAKNFQAERNCGCYVYEYQRNMCEGMFFNYPQLPDCRALPPGIPTRYPSLDASVIISVGYYNQDQCTPQDTTNCVRTQVALGTLTPDGIWTVSHFYAPEVLDSPNVEVNNDPAASLQNIQQFDWIEFVGALGTVHMPTAQLDYDEFYSGPNGMMLRPIGNMNLMSGLGIPLLYEPYATSWDKAFPGTIENLVMGILGLKRDLAEGDVVTYAFTPGDCVQWSCIQLGEGEIYSHQEEYGGFQFIIRSPHHQVEGGDSGGGVFYNGSLVGVLESGTTNVIPFSPMIWGER